MSRKPPRIAPSRVERIEWYTVAIAVSLALPLGLALSLGITRREARLMAVLRGTPRPPEFPAGLDWINTDRPLRLDELRGKVVLLDFWGNW